MLRCCWVLPAFDNKDTTALGFSCRTATLESFVLGALRPGFLSFTSDNNDGTSCCTCGFGTCGFSTFVLGTFSGQNMNVITFARTSTPLLLSKASLEMFWDPLDRRYEITSKAVCSIRLISRAPIFASCLLDC